MQQTGNVIPLSVRVQGQGGSVNWLRMMITGVRLHLFVVHNHDFCIPLLFLIGLVLARRGWDSGLWSRFFD